MTTLQEALSRGKGTERPFNCPIHDDKHASASVNVIKGVWVCYACDARGRVDLPAEIDPHDLVKNVEALLRNANDEIVNYPESWLMLYTNTSEYWEERFSKEAIKHFQLGFDPAKEMPCYPLRSPAGDIHGLVYRNNDRYSRNKYLYPWSISIANYLFNYTSDVKRVVVLVEGAADAIALWEVGIDAFAIYGTRPSVTQINLIKRVDPKLIVIAFDQDTAGNKAAEKVRQMMGSDYKIVRAKWDDNDGKDPAELTEEQRKEHIGQLVL